MYFTIYRFPTKCVAILTVKLSKQAGNYPNLKWRLKVIIENNNSIDKEVNLVCFKKWEWGVNNLPPSNFRTG